MCEQGLIVNNDWIKPENPESLSRSGLDGPSCVALVNVGVLYLLGLLKLLILIFLRKTNNLLFVESLTKKLL